jgi:hypothetical protein
VRNPRPRIVLVVVLVLVLDPSRVFEGEEDYEDGTCHIGFLGGARLLTSPS